jgi:hypothetical protein
MSHQESRQLARIEQLLVALIERMDSAKRDINHHLTKLEHTMSQELKDAVARITASTKRIIDDAVAKLNQPDPDVAGAVTALNTASDNLDAESAALEGSGTGDGSGNGG